LGTTYPAGLPGLLVILKSEKDTDGEKVPTIICNIKVITTYLQVFSLLLQLAFPPCQYHLSATMTTNVKHIPKKKEDYGQGVTGEG